MATNTNEMIREAESLPVEERAKLVDSLLRSLNPTDAAIDRKWLAVAKRRLEELRSGKVKAVPADVVFAEVQHEDCTDRCFVAFFSSDEHSS
jgi:putative addiction module component (TIGR02574 family)